MMASEDEEKIVELPVRLSLDEFERISALVGKARPSRQDGGAEPPARRDACKLAAFAAFWRQARRRRDGAFSGIEFGEPAWDMLLDLYVQHVAGRNVSVTSLCTAAAVPPTTALRWMDVMVRGGHLVRRPDPQDGRRAYVSLSPEMLDGMEVYLDETRRRALAALA